MREALVKPEAVLSTTFSHFLLQNELASVAEIEEASQATVLYGGRLGTSLLELGILAPDQLDHALARYHALPPIPPEWLDRPDAGARAALHLDLIKRHRAFPLFFEKRSLHVGMVDPRNEEVLDQLATAASLRGYKDQAVTPEQMAAVKVPTLGIGGTLDHTLKGMQELKQIRPDMKLVLLEGVSHTGKTGIQGRPELVAEIRKFIAEQQ